MVQTLVLSRATFCYYDLLYIWSVARRQRLVVFLGNLCPFLMVQVHICSPFCVLQPPPSNPTWDCRRSLLRWLWFKPAWSPASPKLLPPLRLIHVEQPQTPSEPGPCLVVGRLFFSRYASFVLVEWIHRPKKSSHFVSLKVNPILLRIICVFEHSEPENLVQILVSNSLHLGVLSSNAWTETSVPVATKSCSRCFTVTPGFLTNCLLSGVTLIASSFWNVQVVQPAFLWLWTYKLCNGISWINLCLYHLCQSFSVFVHRNDLLTVYKNPLKLVIFLTWSLTSLSTNPEPVQIFDRPAASSGIQ